MRLLPTKLCSLSLAAALVLLAPAARAGQRLEITTAAKVQGPDAEAILHALLGEPAKGEAKRQVQVRLNQLHDGSSKLAIAVRGVELPADSVARVRAMFPALREAQIALVEDDAPPAPPQPPEPEELNTPAQIEAYKQKLQAQLAAEGKSGTVEVKVESGPDGKREVRVEVHAEPKP